MMGLPFLLFLSCVVNVPCFHRFFLLLLRVAMGYDHINHEQAKDKSVVAIAWPWNMYLDL
jgi:hypothetical protein